MTHPARTHEEAVALVEKHLQQATILVAEQRENVRRKIEDLSEERLAWRSGPVRVQIEPNRTCDLACLHCDIQHRPDYVLDFDLIKRFFDDVGPGNMEVMPYAGGEPALAPLRELAQIMRRYNNYLSFTTNGQLLDGDTFQTIADVTGRVTFSVHGHTKEIFDFMVPGADYDRIVRNMVDCLEVCESSGTQLLCGLVLNEKNIDHLPDWFGWIADLGIRHAGLTNLYPGTKRMEQLTFHGKRSEEQIRETIQAAMDVAKKRGVFVETNVSEAYYTNFPQNQVTRETPFDIFNDLNALPSLFSPGFCALLANTVTIEYDGTVLPCCRQHYKVGNLHDDDFWTIWNGPAMQRLRATFFQRKLFSGCVKCRDFFCESMHPGSPPVEDLGHDFSAEFA